MWFDKCNWALVQFLKTNSHTGSQQMSSGMVVQTILKTVSRKVLCIDKCNWAVSVENFSFCYVCLVL
jgi:hypothetical protein